MPVQRILVSPKVSGMIVKLNIREGCHVKKGDVLAELENVDYHADFLRAQWAVETARQQLAEAETNQPKEIGQAEAEMERAKVELAQLQADFAEPAICIGSRRRRRRNTSRRKRSFARPSSTFAPWITPWE